MDDNLDGYRPSSEAFHGIRRMLLNAGIEPHTVPNEWVAITIAATLKWLRTTMEGNILAAELLALEKKRGDDDRTYRLTNDFDQVGRCIKPEDVLFLLGTFVEGQPTPRALLKVSDTEKEQCDGCGIRAFCIKELRDPACDTQYSWCNHCVTFHDNPRVNEQGGYDICRGCTVLTCQHHP